MRRLLLLLPLLAACAAPGEGFDQRMSAQLGRTEPDLVAELGVPVASYETEGRRFLDFRLPGRAAPVIAPGLSLGVGSGGFGSGVGVGIGLGAGSYAEPCLVTFELRQGRVIGYTRRSGGCG